MHKELMIDYKACIGCGACVVACCDENDLTPALGQKVYRRLLKLEDAVNNNIRIEYLPLACLHCPDAPCLKACPVQAIYRDEDTAAVLTDKDKCTGCQKCLKACPYAVPQFEGSKIAKCHLCFNRVKAGLNPACVNACPFGALAFYSADTAEWQKRAAEAAEAVKRL